MLEAIGPHTPQRCGAPVFKLASYGTDVDPDVNVYLLRVIGLRRYVEKSKRGKSPFWAIHDRYAHEQFVGVYTDEPNLATLEPAPPSGHNGRGRWATPVTPKGPVGLLMHSLHLAGAVLDRQGFIHQDIL